MAVRDAMAAPGMAVPRRAGRPRLRPWAAGLIGLAVFAAAIEAANAGGLLPALTIPAPSDVIAALIRLALQENLFSALGATLLTALVAVGLGIVVGLPAGYALYRYTSFGLAYRNWLGALFAAPTVLLYPLVLVLFGRSYVSIVVMGFVTGILPIVLGAREAFVAVPPTLLRVGRAFNVSPVQEFWKILLPAGAPMLFTGIRLGTIYTLVNVIGVEFLVNFGGLGYLVSDMYDRFDYPGMYAGILCVVLISGAMLALLKRVEARLRPA
ncbi:MAG: ABC transporter permease subunit [Rhodospirillaceae bacterium]|nr:ABC transporter permease subunit [Rhodospirillaceae bacterium]